MSLSDCSRVCWYTAVGSHFEAHDTHSGRGMNFQCYQFITQSGGGQAKPGGRGLVPC